MSRLSKFVSDHTWTILIVLMFLVIFCQVGAFLSTHDYIYGKWRTNAEAHQVEQQHVRTAINEGVATMSQLRATGGAAAISGP